MEITKLGHCCLLIEIQGIRILTDPGDLTSKQVTRLKIDVLLISHTHSDHLNVEFVTEIVKNNPNIKIFTNKSVEKILEGINRRNFIEADCKSISFKGVKINAYNQKHAAIYQGFQNPECTTFVINNLLFPSDNFNFLNIKVDILALPIAGPFMKLSETVNYAVKIQPKVVIPIHDGYIKKIAPEYELIPILLKAQRIKFKNLILKKAYKF